MTKGALKTAYGYTYGTPYGCTYGYKTVLADPILSRVMKKMEHNNA